MSTYTVILTDAPTNASEVARKQVQEREGVEQVDVLRQHETKALVDGREYERVTIVEVDVR